MPHLVQSLFWSLTRWVSKLRYRVRVEGLEKLGNLRGPTLVLPNHPGYVDPPLVMSHVRLRGGMRPVVTATMYRKAVLYPMMRLSNSLEVPDLSEHSRDAREQTLGMIDAIVAALEQGGNIAIYPSGRAQRRGVEEIGGARAAAEIIERCPQANIVLVRTRGVWGSMFSYARTGSPPDLGRCFLRGLGCLLSNLIFFAPRRQVRMTVELLDRRDLPGASREKLNPYLEAWYNRGGPEQPVFVPYHRLFGPQEYAFPQAAGQGRVDPEKVKPATIRAVNDLVEEHLGHPLGDEENRADMPLDRIGLDSLDRMDVALKIEDRFGFHSDRVAETLGDLWALAEGQWTGAGHVPQPAPPAWNRPSKASGPVDILAETFAEAFVRRVLRQPDDVAVADRISGVLSYRRLLVGARLLAKKLGDCPNFGQQASLGRSENGTVPLEGAVEAVGVLLPASVAADVVFLALHLAGKLPVLLNWTTGPANLAHAVETLKVQRVVTSRKLVDRLGIEIRGAEYVFLEDVRAETGKLKALLALLASYLPAGRLLARLPRPSADDPAVVLFTSGSESTPKAVPLSHRNLISNARASLAVLQATRADSLLAFLPPFHSFGLLSNITGPVLGGVRVVHHPDPTDAAGLVRISADYRPTITVATPTFLSYIFAAAAAADLRSLRLIVTGAEKCPEAIFAKARQMAPQAVILEGYGITECSPVVAANRLERIKQGTVGLPVDGVEVLVVDPESRQPLPVGAVGLLLARGPSIFHGYLNYSGPDPFAEAAGRRWYVTGDLVSVDEDGYIRFSGRLKRFLKAGGEMISLPALEEPFQALYPPTQDGPQVAVEGIETPEGRCIVLFSTQDIPLRKAGAILNEAGFRGVMRLDETVRLDAIPVLGTGKTDYKILRSLVQQRVQAARGERKAP